MIPITIKLDINEIVYDIQNKTFLTGKSRREGQNHELVAAMQANDDEENSNQVLRSISMAFAHLQTKLSEYLDLSKTSADNVLISRDEDLQLVMNMPSNFNRSTIATIADAAHQYIVSLAVADWFTITYKKDAPDYSALAQQSLQVISEAVCRRVRPQYTRE